MTSRLPSILSASTTEVQKATRIMDLTALVLFAHRGAPTIFPENTIESFRAAKDLGADVLEMDVRTTLDGQWVIAHDETLDRCTSLTGRLDESTYDDLRAASLHWPQGHSALQDNRGVEPRMPLLEEVFTAFPTTPLNVDLVDVPPAHVESIINLIRERTARPIPGAEPLIRLVSANDATQRAIRQSGEGVVAFGMSRAEVIEVIRTAWSFGKPIDRLRGIAFQAPAYVHALGLQWPVLTGPVRKLLRQMDCPIHLWRDDGMVDTTEEAEALFKKGANGVFTNEIGTLVAHRQAGLGQRQRRAQ